MYADWQFVAWALLVAAAVLWNMLQGVLRRRRQRRQQLPGGAPAEAPQTVPGAGDLWSAPGPQPLDGPWGHGPASSSKAALDLDLPTRSPPPSPSLRRAPAASNLRLARWRTRAEVRRAMVDAVVLGAPRALAPWTGQLDGRTRLARSSARAAAGR